MSAETANLLRMELETSDRLRGYWQETQTKLNAAIRERDEARADLENERAMRAGEHDDTHSRIEKLHAELVEARAELKEVCKEVHDGELYECRLERERDALRAVIEAHNKMCHDQCEIWAEITLLPAAAAPEAGPDFWALATEHGDEVAAPEAGPKDDGECRSCVNGQCVTGPECVALDNPVTPWEVTCARCGKVGLSSEFEVEEGDEWECRPCNERENARERPSPSPAQPEEGK